MLVDDIGLPYRMELKKFGTCLAIMTKSP